MFVVLWKGSFLYVVMSSRGGRRTGSGRKGIHASVAAQGSRV